MIKTMTTLSNQGQADEIFNISPETQYFHLYTAHMLGRDSTNFCHCPINLLLTYFWGAEFAFCMKILRDLTLFTRTSPLVAAFSPLDHSWNNPSHRPKSSFKSSRRFPPSQWSFNQSLLWSTVTCEWRAPPVWLALGQDLQERRECRFLLCTLIMEPVCGWCL